MTAMTATATTYFTLNFLNKTIVGTKASFNKASKGVGAEYEELAAKMKAHPEYVIEFKVPKHKSTKAKRSYDGLNFAFIEAYLEACEKPELDEEYKGVKRYADKHGLKSYPLVKKWFIDKFGDGENGFDMNKANEMISDYRLKKAKENNSSDADLTNENEEDE